jgi:hypothetical protein
VQIPGGTCGLQRSRSDGTYLIYDVNTNGVAGGPGMGLDDVARWVNS